MKRNQKDWSSIEKTELEYWINRLDKSSILQELPKKIKEDWNSASLRAVDAFLEKHCKEISCADVSAIYWKFWLDLKKIKSNSTNFVGYSEFLVLRLLLHYLKVSFYSQSSAVNSIPNYPLSKKYDLGYFVLGDEKLFIATECIPKEFRKDLKRANLEKRRPDIVLYKTKPKPKLMAIVQVKAAPPSKTSVDKDSDFFKKLKKIQNYEDVEGLIVVFGKYEEKPGNGSIYPLWDDSSLISNVFFSRLKLDRLREPLS